MPQDLLAYSPDDLGEAMLALSNTQRRYVIALVTLGGKKVALAYQMATGCAPASAEANAWRMNTPAVMAAIREEADRRLRGGALLGASVLVEIAEDIMHKDRFKAAQSLLDRAGLIVATEHKITVEDKRTPREIMASIARIAKEGGLDVSKMIVDAEFEEVKDVTPDFTGLEDI